MLNINTYRPEQFSDLIERVWIAENSGKEVELVIPPNQYVNLILPFSSSQYKRNQKWINTPQTEGISTENTVLTYPAGTKLIGVRFFAFGLYPFFQIHGKNLINNSLEYFFEAESIKEIVDCSYEDFDANLIHKVHNLLSNLFCANSYDSILKIMNFYNQFRWNDETYSIDEYCQASETNYTTLNRIFTRVVGITPKKFERLIKFRKALCDLIDSEERLTSISVNSGYFDQAHFIREFKMFINQTPSAYKALIKKADKESKIINYNFKLF